VGLDGKIEVDAHEMAPSQRVTVTIQPEEAPVRNLHMLDLIEQSPGQRLFKTAEEVDAYIRQERNVTGLVDALQADGFVMRSPHPTDQRTTLVTLTEQGGAAAAS
jgi:DNA-binding MarR family transcriptional regulator